MTAALPSFTVLVASHSRPRWLNRCLTAVRQLDYPRFEVVVVADTPSLDAIVAHKSAVKTVAFEDTNLSCARNAGLSVARGDWVALIDDDSVPEPTWLMHFADAAEQLSPDAMVGYVRGRNGISYQSKTEAIDAEAETHKVAWDGDKPGYPELGTGRALKLIGTNMCVRRDRLLDLCGFDAQMRYFLEDADLSLRLARAGGRSAVVPLAEVHHAVASSARRTSLRRPRQLHDIGRSTAVYMRRHPGIDGEELYGRMARREARRLARHLVNGTCEPHHFTRLMKDLKAGWDDGLAASLPPLRPIEDQTTEFTAVTPIGKRHEVFTGRFLARTANKTAAKRAVAQKARASVFNFSLTLARHHVRFTEDGYWLQTGGQFGRSERDKPLFWGRFRQRVAHEVARVAKMRGIVDIACNQNGAAKS